MDNGDTLRVAHKGEAGASSGPPGDLYVVIVLRTHPRFRRREFDLHAVQEISFLDASLGTKIPFKTLDGEETLKVREGTQPGDVIRLKSKGVPRLQERGRGDLHIQLMVTLPPKLNRKQRKAMESLKELF